MNYILEKEKIAKYIKNEMQNQGLTFRQLSNKINNNNIPISYSQINRVTSGENYNIDNDIYIKFKNTNNKKITY